MQNESDTLMPLDIKGAEVLENGYRIPGKIAKTGMQEFSGQELSGQIPNLDPSARYQVEVTAEELFSAATIASFEGKPLTLFHAPKNTVTPENWRETAVGHVQNVRQDGDYLVADVFLYDAEAINAIKSYQIKELSCGYDADIVPSDTAAADFRKTNIRGDHVAVVDVGRSGHDVKLGDRTVSLKAKLDALKGQQKQGDEGEETLDSVLSQMGDYVQLLTESGDEATKEIGDILSGLLTTAQSLAEKQPEQQSENLGDEGEDSALSDPAESETDEKKIIETLKKQVDELTEKLKKLEDENAQLKAEKELVETEAEAKSTFGDVAIGHARSARQIKEKVIVAKGIATQQEVKKLGDSAIDGKYDYLVNRQREQNKPRVKLGDRKSTRSAAQRLGGQ